MIRTFWLATICLAVLSTLAVGKAVMILTPSPVTEQPTDLTTLGAGLTQATLGKADRLEITPCVRRPQPLRCRSQPSLSFRRCVVPPPVENKIISRHWRDPNAFSSAKKPKQAKQRLGQEGQDRRKGNQASIGPNPQIR